MSSFIPGFSYDSFGAYSLFKKKKKNTCNLHVTFCYHFFHHFENMLKN